MKKIIVLIMVVVMCNVIPCFAMTTEAQDAGDGPQLWYVTVQRSSAELNISGNTANYQLKVYPQAGKTISKVTATLKLVDSKGTVIKTKLETVYFTNGYFKIEDSKNLTNRGAYHVEYTAKIYNGIQLIETINGRSGNDTY